MEGTSVLFLQQEGGEELFVVSSLFLLLFSCCFPFILSIGKD
jgi:hypothetical protein